MNPMWLALIAAAASRGREPGADLWLPGPGRVPIKYGPLDSEVEYIFARELGPPGV
jgi:hypothetical protein